MLCLRYGSIVPSEEIEFDHGDSFRLQPIGTGPFKLTGYDRKKGRVELDRFADYWKPDEPRVDTLTVEYSDNGDELFQKLNKGELDLIREDSAQRISSLMAHSDWRSCEVSAPQLDTPWLVFDARQTPFDDIAGRQAFVHAIVTQELGRLS